MGNRGRLDLLWPALATLVPLLIAGCADFWVNPSLSSISVTPQTSSIRVGASQQLTATGNFSDGSFGTVSVTWSSSADGVATVNSGGLVTGVSPGNATITATSGTATGAASITVCGNITSITISPLNQTVLLGQQTPVQFKATSSGGQDITNSVTWSSSNPSVATISNSAGSNGVVMLTGRGMTTITASSCSITASTLLTVN